MWRRRGQTEGGGRGGGLLPTAQGGGQGLGRGATLGNEGVTSCLACLVTVTDHGHQGTRIVCQVDTLVLSLHHALGHGPLVHLHQAVVHNDVQEVIQVPLVLRYAEHLELLPLVEGAGGERTDGVVQSGGVLVLVTEENLRKLVIPLAPVTIIPEVQGEAQGTTFLHTPGHNILRLTSQEDH